MKKILLLCFFLALISGCAHDAKLKSFLNSAVHIDQVKKVLGTPSHVADMHDGAKLYEWSKSRDVMIGGMSVSRPNNYSGSSHGGNIFYKPIQHTSFFCEIRVEVSETGLVLNWSHAGNNCDDLVLKKSYRDTH